MLLIVVTLLVSMTAAAIDLNESFHACGPALDAALLYYCNQTARSIPTRNTRAVDSDEPQLQIRRTLLNVSGARIKRGVADDCCRKYCTIGILMEYCASFG